MAELKWVGYGQRFYGDVLFHTDGAYDIGKTGATRPRHIYASGNMVLGGSLTAGAISGTTGMFSGKVAMGGAALTRTATVLTAPTTADADGIAVYNSTRELAIEQTGATYNYMGVGANQNLIYFGGADLSIATDGAYALRLHTSGVERLTIASGGAATFSSTLAVTGQATFTGNGAGSSSGIVISAATASIGLRGTTGAADTKLWDIAATGPGLFFRAVADDGSTAVNWLAITRSGTAVSAVDFTTASASFSGTLAVTGAATFGAGAERFEVYHAGAFPSFDYNSGGVTFRLLTAAAGLAALQMGALTTNGGLQTFGANDTGGAGYRLVLVPNA